MKEDGKRPREICAVKKGYGMAIGDMRPIEGATLYSVLSKLPKVVPSTLEDNKQKQAAYQAKYHSIKDLIQTSSVPFFVSSVNQESCNIDMDFSVLDEDEKPVQIKLTNWTTSSEHENSPVDISIEDAIRATNASTIEDACCLLELAASAGALSLLVCYNQYRCWLLHYMYCIPATRHFSWLGVRGSTSGTLLSTKCTAILSLGRIAINDYVMLRIDPASSTSAAPTTPTP